MSAMVGGPAGPASDPIWWARATPEPALPVKNCSKSNCHHGPRSPFDLYCDADEPHFLILGEDSRSQVFAVYSARGIFGVLALATAALTSPVPLYVAVCLAGLLMLWLPLRAFPTARITGAIAWVAAIGFLGADAEGLTGPSTRGQAIASLALLALAGLVAAVFLQRDGSGPDQGLARRSIAGGLALALAAAAVAALLATGVVDAPNGIQQLALIGAIVAAGGALGAAALTGFVDRARTVKHDPPFHPPRRLSPPSATEPGLPPAMVQPGLANRLAHSFQIFSARIARSVVRLANRSADILWRAADLVVHTTLRAAHAVRNWVVRVCLVLAATAVGAGVALLDGGALTAKVTRRWAESTVLLIVAVVLAAAAAVTASSAFSSYLDDGPLSKGLTSPLLAALASATLVVAWWALTKWPRRKIADSAARSAWAACPSVFVTLVVLGWVDGLAGIAGAGSLRPGFLTIGGTVVLLGIVLHATVKNRSVPATP